MKINENQLQKWNINKKLILGKIKEQNMPRNAVKITLVIMIITAISRVLGFFREMVIAAKFGAGIESDAFFIAYMIPGTIFAAIATAIGTTFIPIYTKKNGLKERLVFTNNLINITSIIAIIITIISMFFSNYLVSIFAPGFSGSGFDLAVKLTRIMMTMLLFLTLNSIFASILQSHERFYITAGLGIPFNLIIVGYLVLYGNSLGIAGLAWIVVLGVIGQVIIQVPSLIKTGWRYKVILNWKEEGFQQIIKLVGPVILGAMVGQINVIVDRMLASHLVEGSISALNYANRLNQLSYAIVVMAIVSVLYPRLSKLFASNQIDAFKMTTMNGLESMIIILLPITVGGGILATPIIQLLFQRGAFDSTATSMTSIAFVYYSIGLIGLGIRELLSRVFYSLQDTKTPMINGIIALVINIILNLILIKYMQHAGLALGSSISLLVASLLLYGGLAKKIGKLNNKYFTISFIKAMVASMIMAIFVYKLYYFYDITKYSLIIRFGWLLLSVLFGVLIYLLVSLLLKQRLVLLTFSKIFNNKKPKAGTF
ncbi:murein biosynthesis integral membrane protein MurJ [Tepidibacillus fermentans]|uniref:Probable lipid II flippase MurJ n=1 Tax=Tepidibacillus fermentans TaxID=1281767 RepID=A0A4R3KII5_9BACI|nr:murein biosynthesis integral membrane protein MurJ [Tepidibacillus fermentans]TCS83376.1 putative peptidoglycan lipid II flippase [Tepidibacillus fermentans]